MKRFFEKYDLIKVAGILVLLSVILTWLIPYGYFTGTEVVKEEITRVGLTNFMQYGLLGIYYFTVLVTFLIVLAGFYQILSRVSGYQTLVKNISKKLKGHETLFVVLTTVVLSALCSLTSEYFPLLVFIPFIISVMNRLKINKLAAFSATFGALLVGTIGSVYSQKVAGVLNEVFGAVSIWYRVILFVVALGLMLLFILLNMKKNKSDKAFEEYDKFEVESYKSGKSARVWPYVVCLCLLAVVIILAYLPWATWNVTAFANATKWVNNITIFGVPIFSYLIGTFVEFGSWDIFTIQFVLLFIILLIHWFGKVKFDEIIESFGEGFKKISYVLVVLLAVYAILIFSVMFPVIPVIVDWICGLAKGFNVLLASISAFITSLFGVEMQYVANLSGAYFATTYAEHVNALSIIFQSAFGLISFVAPSSAILMIGLAYMNIPYKDWIKYIWKFALAMLLAVIILIAVMLLI